MSERKRSMIRRRLKTGAVLVSRRASSLASPLGGALDVIAKEKDARRKFEAEVSLRDAYQM